ncbi:MAG: hypothetical protein ACYCV0_12840 [Desulfitobacteriaceae bacterium]
MANFTNRTAALPVLLFSEKTSYYLHTSPQGVALYTEKRAAPLFQLSEPVLLAQAAVNGAQQVHLVILKANGELCYTVVSEAITQQTATLAKLDVRTARYRRLMLFPLGKMVHIFYAYAHQAIADLWHIEHRFWNGQNWRSVHLGEVAQTREPLYTVTPDTHNNLHLLMLTCYGQRTILLSNRFNGTFTLWGKPMENLHIPREVVDIASLMTPANIHYLFWISKKPGGQYELGWAQRTQSHELSSVWYQAPAPLKLFKGPYHGLGSMEAGGKLWLLLNAEQTTLLHYQGERWKELLSTTAKQRPIQFIPKVGTGSHSTYWLEGEGTPRVPAFYQQLGIPVNLPPLRPQGVPAHANTTSPVPAPQSLSNSQVAHFSPNNTSAPSKLSSEPLTIPNTNTTAPPTEFLTPAESTLPTESTPPDSSMTPAQDSAQYSAPAAEHYLEPVSNGLPSQASVSNPELLTNQFYALEPMITEALSPILKTVSDLDQQNRTLSVVLESMLSKHTKTESSLHELEKQLSVLLHKNENTEKGFWEKWFR